MSGGANSARSCYRRMHERPSDSVLTNVAMTGGTAIRESSRANGLPPLSARFVGRDSHLTNRQNTVPEHVSTYQDDHNHQRHIAAFFIAISYCSSAGFNVQMQGGYIQTQGYIVKRKEPMVKRKKAPAFDHSPHFYCKMLFST